MLKQHLPVPEGVKFKEALVRYLRGFTWTTLVHLTFKNEHSVASAESATRHWLEWLQSQVGGVYGFLAVEGSPYGERIHVHAVLGGPAFAQLEPALASWRYFHGRVEASPYDPGRNGLEYITKQVHHESYHQMRWNLVGKPRQAA